MIIFHYDTYGTHQHKWQSVMSGFRALLDICFDLLVHFASLRSNPPKDETRRIKIIPCYCYWPNYVHIDAAVIHAHSQRGRT